MYRKTSNVVKGVSVGIAAIAAVSAIGATMRNGRNPRKTIKKTASKAMHTVNSVLGDVERMLR